MCKITTKYYLVHDEPEHDELEPTQRVKSKRFIIKVMFLVVVARPRIDFSRKIGIFPFTFTEQQSKIAKQPQVMRTIIIQQDNAKSHIDCNGTELMQAVSRNGFDIRLTSQLPNSPDLSVLDLQIFFFFFFSYLGFAA